MKKIIVIATLILGSVTIAAQENKVGISFFQNYCLTQLEKENSGQEIFNRTFSVQSGLLFNINKE